MKNYDLRVSVKTLAVPEHWKLQFAQHAPSPDPESATGALLNRSGELKAPTIAPAVEVPIVPTARILIAEDDTVSRRVLAARLLQWGFEPVITRDGNEAMSYMRNADAPSIALLDWMMPGMDGVEVCRRVRSINKSVYIIMLTALKEQENLAEAFKAGADDYVAKPWSPLELEARINVGLRIMGLQQALMSRVAELEKSVSELKDRTPEFDIPI